MDLSYGDSDNHMLLLEEVSRLLNAYVKAILTPAFLSPVFRLLQRS
jgi:hypothetical protein